MSQPGGPGAGIPEMPRTHYPAADCVVKGTVAGAFRNLFWCNWL
jgi:hypothetical protein